MESPFEPFRSTLDTFADSVGGTVQWDPPGTNQPSVSIEWFQKNIQRSILIQMETSQNAFSILAYASTLKRGKKWSRQKLTSGIPMDRPFDEILEEGRILSQSFMEKSFLPEEDATRF